MSTLKFIYMQEAPREEKAAFESRMNEIMKDRIDEINNKGGYIEVTVVKLFDGIQLVPSECYP